MSSIYEQSVSSTARAPSCLTSFFFINFCARKYYFELVNKVQEFYDAFVDNDDSKGDLIQYDRHQCFFFRVCLKLPSARYNAKALADLEVKAMAHLEAETEQVRLKLAEAHQQKHQLLLGKQQQVLDDDDVLSLNYALLIFVSFSLKKSSKSWKNLSKCLRREKRHIRRSC